MENVQVWLLDEGNFFTGESTFVEEVTENMTTVPYTVGYVKGKLVNGEWVEGATEEEIEAFKALQPTPQAPVKTNEELEQENILLKEQLSFHEELIAEMAMKLYA